jgi:pimeloyl-ACP methyl ester carboxylesterase
MRRPKSAAAPWILFYPGNDATQLRRGQGFLTRVAEERDWGLALYAYRGYDSSGGTPRLNDLATDAFEIFDKLCASERVAPANVHIVGFSIGGHLAVRAVGAAARRNLRPGSLSLLASVDDIVMVRRSFWERLDPGDDYQTRPYLGDVPGPVLVLQGTEDEALDGPGQGRAIAAALGARAQYVELPGMGHNALLESDAAVAKLRAFIGTASGQVEARH